MFDTIILLADAVEEAPLATVLCDHNPRLTIHAAATADEIASLDAAALARARLIAFSTSVIVPPGVLTALGYGGYNFHPGPPQYPGWAPAPFAPFEHPTPLRAALPLMARSFGSGPPLPFAFFSVPPPP